MSPIADIHCFNYWLGGVAWGLCLGNSAEPGLLEALPWVAKQTHTPQQYYRVLSTLHPSSPMVTSCIAVIPYQGQAIGLETILLTRLQTLLRSIVHMQLVYVCACACVHMHTYTYVHPVLGSFTTCIGSCNPHSHQDRGLSLHHKGTPLCCP